ncbi:hypothetical protein EVAR_90338_1 [Eumeta japonica]|uniref:Uncharacterized protein n=1 Tax=Eumeta variegata TaxID=151549 RepID=A0A4C1YKK0_EUMVA|nr:hypothetical protein EVAR_90338_1 [Eumeta japonica]
MGFQLETVGVSVQLVVPTHRQLSTRTRRTNISTSQFEALKRQKFQFIAPCTESARTRRAGRLSPEVSRRINFRRRAGAPPRSEPAVARA